MDSLVGLDKIVAPQEIDLVDDTEQDWIDDPSESEVEFEPETEQMHEQELTKLRMLEWLHETPSNPKQTMLKIQDVDQNTIKYISHDNTESNWVAPDGPLRVPESNLDLAIDGDFDGYFCPGSGGRTHPHQKTYDQKTRSGKGNRRAGRKRSAKMLKKSAFWKIF